MPVFLWFPTPASLLLKSHGDIVYEATTGEAALASVREKGRESDYGASGADPGRG